MSNMGDNRFDEYGQDGIHEVTKNSKNEDSSNEIEKDVLLRRLHYKSPAVMGFTKDKHPDVHDSDDTVTENSEES